MPVIHETGLIAAPVPVYFETFAPAAATGRATIVMVHGGAHSGACYQLTADGRRGGPISSPNAATAAWCRTGRAPAAAATFRSIGSTAPP